MFEHVGSCPLSPHRKHIGFVAQSFIESFFEFLLQLFVLLLYFNWKHADDDDPESTLTVTHYVSLLLSLLSLSSSCFVFCHSIWRQLMVFNVLCLSADVLKFFVCIIWLFEPPFLYHPLSASSAAPSFFFYLWTSKLVAITAVAALYLAVQMVWHHIDYHFSWHHVSGNFGRRRSISRSLSKSKSGTNSSHRTSSRTASRVSSKHHLSTYHISDVSAKHKSRRRHRSRLWRALVRCTKRCCGSKDVECCTELLFSLCFAVLVLLLWPFCVLLLEITAFSG